MDTSIGGAPLGAEDTIRWKRSFAGEKSAVMPFITRPSTKRATTLFIAFSSNPRTIPAVDRNPSGRAILASAAPASRMENDVRPLSSRISDENRLHMPERNRDSRNKPLFVDVEVDPGTFFLDRHSTCPECTLLVCDTAKA